MSSYLADIESPHDLRRLSRDELGPLCREIREAILTTVSVTGGHLASNLGFVEATVAIHYVFDTPADQLVFDVSHQCYAHKILTGRKAAYLDPEHYGAYTGFTNPAESDYDIFRAGHTSQGVSLAAGLAKARDLTGATHNVVCVIGDGALSGGEAFEGLDNLHALGSNLIVVFNDNEMSIAGNVGGIYENLAELRSTGGSSEHNFFRTLGLDYRYVEDGNDVDALVDVLEEVRGIDHPVVVHVHTRKGKGSAWAEAHPEQAHMVAPEGTVAPPGLTYQELTRQIVGESARLDPTLVVVNAGAPTGVGLLPEFRASLGSQFVDTGITEQHAVAFSSGLAKGGARPVFMVMATFAQRAFDQFVQELGLNRSPATVLIFGAGFYDIDATHAGTLDIVMTSNIPNITCLAPAREREYADMLSWAIAQTERPVVIRVPERMLPGGEGAFVPARPGGWHVREHGSRICFLTIGASVELAYETAALLREAGLAQPTIVEALNYSSFDESLLESLKADHEIMVTIEAGILCGGFGEKVCRYFGKDRLRVLAYGGRKEFLDCVPTEEFFKLYHFTAQDIASDLLALEP